jgi:enoyl-CoA hydratase/carnithine racemase
MPIHYEKNDEHTVLITIDRPEARNALDMFHFRDLAAAWRDFRYDDDAWVAIVTGVGRNGRRRPQDLHPAGDEAPEADRQGGAHRARRLQAE